MEVVGFRPRPIMWMLSLTPAQLQHGGTLSSSPEACPNWEPGACWTWPCAEHSVLRPSPGQPSSSCSASVQCQQLGSATHPLRQNWSETWITTMLHIWLLLEWHEAGNYTQPKENRWRRVSGPCHGEQKQPIQGFKEKVTYPGTETCPATLSKSLKNLHDPATGSGLQRCGLCASVLFMLCSNISLWHGEYGNWLLPLLLSGGVGSVSTAQEQPLLVAGSEHQRELFPRDIKSRTSEDLTASCLHN